MVDLTTDDELRRVILSAWEAEPAWIDWDGRTAVIGDWERSSPLMVLADGTVVRLPAGTRPVLWHSP